MAEIRTRVVEKRIFCCLGVGLLGGMKAIDCKKILYCVKRVIIEHKGKGKGMGSRSTEGMSEWTHKSGTRPKRTNKMLIRKKKSGMEISGCLLYLFYSPPLKLVWQSTDANHRLE